MGGWTSGALDVIGVTFHIQSYRCGPSPGWPELDRSADEKSVDRSKAPIDLPAFCHRDMHGTISYAGATMQ